MEAEPEPFRPPEGLTFYCPTLLDGAALCRALCAGFSLVVEELKPRAIIHYEDWYNVEGRGAANALFELQRLSAGGAREIIATPRELLEWMTGEPNVYLGFAPADWRWYLRTWFGWSQDGFSLGGRFELTVPDQTAERLQSELETASPPDTFLKAASRLYYTGG